PLVLRQVDVLAPAGLRIYRVGLPERVEVGQSFEITADVWNPGRAPLTGLTGSLVPATPGLIGLSGPAQAIPQLDADGWTTVSWRATALQAGRLVGRIDATAGALRASAPLSGLLAEPGHAVDLVVDGVGQGGGGGRLLG